MKDELLQLFVSVCKKPRMHLQTTRFDVVCGFIDGYNTALAGGPLLGFREFLLCRTTDWNNAPWWALVRRIVDAECDLGVPPSEEHQDKLLEALGQLLEDFGGTHREKGMVGIMAEYIAWLPTVASPEAERILAKLHATPPR